MHFKDPRPTEKLEDNEKCVAHLQLLADDVAVEATPSDRVECFQLRDIELELGVHREEPASDFDVMRENRWDHLVL